STGRGRRRRAIGGGSARRARAQPARNRAQPVADFRGGSRSHPPPHRRGGAALQGAGDERRAPAARRRPGRRQRPAIVNTQQDKLTSMTKTSNVLFPLMFAAALAAPAAAQPGPGPIGPGPIGVGPVGPGPMGPPPGVAMSLRDRIGLDVDDRADELYSDGREAIEEGKY